jgi:hypothetical protein
MRPVASYGTRSCDAPVSVSLTVAPRPDGDAEHRYAQQQLAQRPRKIGADRPVGVQQGLGEQGVPAAALIYGANDRGGRRLAEDPFQLGGDLIAGQPGSSR